MEQGPQWVCPRCGLEYDEPAAKFSRDDKTYVCGSCCDVVAQLLEHTPIEMIDDMVKMVMFRAARFKIRPDDANDIVRGMLAIKERITLG